MPQADTDTQPERVRLRLGDVVDVRGHGRATVIGPYVDDPSHKFHGRYHVRYHEDDTTFHVGHARLRLMLPVSTPAGGP